MIPPSPKRKHPHLKAPRSFQTGGLRKEEPRSQACRRSRNRLQDTQSLGGVNGEKKEMLLRKKESHSPLTHHWLASRILQTRGDPHRKRSRRQRNSLTTSSTAHVPSGLRTLHMTTPTWTWTPLQPRLRTTGLCPDNAPERKRKGCLGPTRWPSSQQLQRTSSINRI